MPPALWAMLVAPIWVALSTLIVALLVEYAGVTWISVLLLLGWGLGTVAALGLDLRTRGPDMPGPGFGRPDPRLVLWALLAGVGTAILSSEVDNLLRARFETVEPARPDTKALLTEGPMWLYGLVTGLFMPFTRAIVVHGIVLRNMVFSAPMSWSIAFSTFAYFFSLSGDLSDWLKFALPAGVAGWAYVRAHNVWVSTAALVGSFSGVWFEVLGVGPGIPGFDQVDPTQVLFQPFWFNALGVVALAAGVGLLIREFEQRPFSKLVLAADARRPGPSADD